MITGTGIDIVEIKRIEKACLNPLFIEKFFSLNEIEYFRSCNNRSEVIAGNFAAKEAFSKAIGTGFCGISLKSVEILRDELGKPFIISPLSGKFHVSISHSRDNAVAMVVAEEGV